MKLYGLDNPCSKELSEDFPDGVYLKLFKDPEDCKNLWNGFVEEGDVGFSYEIVRSDVKPYERGFGRKGHVLLRNGEVAYFMSHNVDRKAIEDIRNEHARERVKNISRNIEDIIKRDCERIFN